MSPFRQAVDCLHPGATGRDLVELLDGRAKRNAALHWYAGRNNPPPWALQLLAAKLRASAEPLRAIARDLERIPERPGLRAGAKNLAAYLARR